MKPPTRYLAEMTNPELERFLGSSQTVIVPVGSIEQHGPHGPLGTDAFVPTEVAGRIAERVDAAIGFTRIVFLNGHYDNTYAIAYACASAAERMPAGVRAFPINYWDGMTPTEAGEFFDPATGLHANRGETSAVLAINPALVDMDRANIEFPPFPEVTNAGAVHTAFFFSAPGSVHRATHSGTWGDAREATPEFGERYLEVVVEATVRTLDDIERTFGAMPPR